ncbi:phage tail length tape measure family protein (plasmid) [Bradyrhizobium elkanii]|uniref:phage tail length tape measure family protein n=1 Tax=Bradyrhizobium elkanii TaxID=29448 RepID=UPI0027144C53|nr:phage tail length tape measure family protein [Bradyrhizobium elkanii]WLB14833.1 phage tail length tape measure family protein [Bradyrhizobium elkanii]WLB69075.1 phage tail length tape measure family protein [Bradyrhizobium elkanii]
MKESDLVRTVTIRHKSEGADQVKSDLKSLASAQDELAASSQNLATVTETSAKRQASQLTQFERMERAQNQAAKALNDFNKASTVASNVLGNPAVSDDRIINFLQVYVDRLDAATAAQNRLAQAKNPFSSISIDERLGIGTSSSGSAEASANAFLSQFGGLDGIASAKAQEAGQAFSASLNESLIAGIAKSAKESASVFQANFDQLDTIAQQRAQQIGGNFQKSLNESFGIGAAPKSASASASVFQEAADAQDKMAASASRLRAAINPLEAEQARLAAELQEYKKALDAGYISTDHYSAAQSMAGKRLSDFEHNLKTAGSAGRVMSGELANLGFQLNDVITGLSLGQSIPMIVAQQGGQVVQIFQTSKASVSELASSAVSAFGSMFTAGRLAFGGIAAAVGTVVYANASYIQSQREVAQSLIGIGAKTQTTAGQINDFAKQNASALGLSIDQARNLGIEFTKTGNISVAGLKDVGEAVHGFAILTGQSVDDASKAFAKAFSGSVVDGAEELNKTYGFLNATTRDYIRSLELQGERSAAINFVIQAMAKDNAAAADSVSLLGKAYDYLANAASKAKNVIGAGTAPQSNEDQLAALEKQKAALEAQQAAQSQRTGLQRVHDFINPANLIANPISAIQDVLPPSLDNVNKALDALKEKIAGIKADNVVKQLDAMSIAGDDAVRSAIPEIAQIEKLRAELEKLNAAQNTPGVKPGALAGQNDAASLVRTNQIAALQEAQEQADRYNQRVAKISTQWGDVGQSTALALQSAQNQLPVLEAVGGAAKIAAQATADYKNYLDQGKKASEALALAASNEASARAQVNAAAKEQLAALKDQYAVASASDVQGQISAQGAATYNQLLRQGVDAATASAVAAQQEANARAQVYNQMQKAVQASQDQLDLVNAQATGQEANVRAAIAYRDAIQAGATATQAAAIWSNTLQANLQQAAIAAAKVEIQSAQDLNSKISGAVYDSAGNLVGINNGTGVGSPSTGGRPSYFNTDGKQYTSVGGDPRLDQFLRTLAKQENLGISGLVDTAYSGGDLVAAIKAVKNAPNTYGAEPVMAASLARKGYDLNAILGPQRSTIDDKISQMDTLVQLQNAKTNNKDEQVANLKAEMDWLQALPETISRDQKIVSLQQSIDSLKNATDANTAATAATLNPLYSQGHSALPQIGYFHAASGLDVVAQGPTVGDQVPFKAMVNGGERIRIMTAAEQASSSTSNDNRRNTTIINNFSQVSTNSARRVQRQVAQGFGQALAAVG